MRRNLGGMIALAAMLSATGCDDGSDDSRGGGGGPGGGKADEADGDDDGMRSEAQERHLQQVGACESLAARGRDTVSDLRIPETLEIEETRLDCLEEANDATVDELNAALSDASSALAGDTSDVFNTWRSEHASFCGLMVEASVDALTKAASVRQTACRAVAEVKLAEAIEAFGDLGGIKSKAAAAEETYEDCYETYDEALEAISDTPAGDGEMSEADMTDAEDELVPMADLAAEATEVLATCIQSATEELEDDIAARVVDSFPGRATTGIEEDVNDVVRDALGAADSTCELLVKSSGGEGLALASCEVSTSIWRADLISFVVPELAE